MAPENFRIYQRGYFERRHPFKRNNIFDMIFASYVMYMLFTSNSKS